MAKFEAYTFTENLQSCLILEGDLNVYGTICTYLPKDSCIPPLKGTYLSTRSDGRSWIQYLLPPAKLYLTFLLGV